MNCIRSYIKLFFYRTSRGKCEINVTEKLKQSSYRKSLFIAFSWREDKPQWCFYLWIVLEEITRSFISEQLIQLFWRTSPLKTKLKLLASLKIFCNLRFQLGNFRVIAEPQNVILSPSNNAFRDCLKSVECLSLVEFNKRKTHEILFYKIIQTVLERVPECVAKGMALLWR